MAGRGKSEETKHLKLITLYREAVHQVEPNDECRGADEHRRLTLTMDYFDALEVKSFSTKDDIREFLGQDTNERLREHDIAMHSIPLYWPNNTFTVKFANNNPHYGDPLNSDKAEEQNKAAFLCLIQVYITPEVLRRLDLYGDSEGDSSEAASNAYDFFFKDLHEAMRDYTEKCLYEISEDGCVLCKDESFSYCIYQSLSIGDYVIGIRCGSLDYVFQIMEAIRRRKFVKINGDDVDVSGKSPNSLILYKTYTIVSINDLVIPEADDTAKTLVEGNRFILRAVLSNHYWNDEKEIEKEFPPDIYLYSSEFKRLHGRYNFSVELSEAAFLRILPTIEKYKLNNRTAEKKTVKLKEREEKICAFLEFLLEKGYISHLNERYVSGSEFRKLENTKDIAEEVIPFCGLRKKQDYFNDTIKEELKELDKRIRAAEVRVKGLDTSRSTISYNMILLRRLVNICSTINGYSDSRIYAVIIIRLVYAALNGIEEFLNYFDNTDDHDIIKYLDSELNGLIVDLKEFSDYILDNSLQSLQTPDYNLESHISVEKLMMSYSAFLQNVIDWYGSTDFAKRTGGLQDRYVAIMVPKAIDNGLSTKVYFYRQEDGPWKEKEKLLVVNCPSFYTLTDFSGSLGRLLHELAHNLRYETRAERNDLIVRYSAGVLLNPLVVDIVGRVQTEVETLRDTVAFQNLLEKIFKEEFVTYILKDIPDYGEMKLHNLTRKIENCYQHMIDSIHYLGIVKRYINKFARSSDSSMLTDDEVEALWDFYERFFGEPGASWEENEEKSDEAEQIARKQLTARRRLADALKRHLFEGGSPREENRNKIDAYGLFDVLCSGFPDEFVDDDLDEYTDQRAEEGKHRLEIQFYTICIRTASFIRRLTEGVAKMLNTYQHTPDGRKIARYLSMGYYFVSDDSSIDFIETAQNSLLRTRIDSLAIWTDNLYMYREIASDLYMVKLLGLTPFGYLNFCTKYIPADGNLNRQFVSRMAVTIYAMSGENKDEGAGDQYSRWLELFSALCSYIESVTREILQKKENQEMLEALVEPEYETPLREYLKNFAERMNYYAAHPEETGDYMQNRADKFARHLKWFSTHLKDDFDIQNLMHCIFLCKNFIQIANYYGTEVGEIEWAPELSEDLLKGGRVLEDLHKELEKSSLYEYCQLIQEAFNEPQKTNKRVREDLPAEAITKFVLGMHYDMLFRNINKFGDRQNQENVVK